MALQVIAWEARGKAPLGAEITAALHELRMRDQGISSASKQQAAEPESLLRLQYAMLIIRLVNGISDSSQKGRIAMSVSNLAEDAGQSSIQFLLLSCISYYAVSLNVGLHALVQCSKALFLPSCAGIPRILVDVRHDASHNELPSLALLRLASSAALSWLSSAYWQRQADHLESCRAHIRSLLQVLARLPNTLLISQSHNSLKTFLCCAHTDHRRIWHVQRYMELQRAAILKQAITGKSEDEDLAVVNAADAQGDSMAYSGAVGQKQRREVVTELWDRVHSAAHLLVGPLLDDGACPDPHPT